MASGSEENQTDCGPHHDGLRNPSEACAEAGPQRQEELDDGAGGTTQHASGSSRLSQPLSYNCGPSNGHWDTDSLSPIPDACPDDIIANCSNESTPNGPPGCSFVFDELLWGNEDLQWW